MSLPKLIWASYDLQHCYIAYTFLNRSLKDDYGILITDFKALGC